MNRIVEKGSYIFWAIMDILIMGWNCFFAAINFKEGDISLGNTLIVLAVLSFSFAVANILVAVYDEKE